MDEYEAQDTEDEDEQEESSEDRKSSDIKMLEDFIYHDNIADELTDDELNEISQKACRGYDIDKASRNDWVSLNKTAMDLAQQITKDKNFPWTGASNVVYPLMTQAAIQFAARAYPALIEAGNVVKGTVVGADAGTPALDDNGRPVAIQNPETGEVEIQWEVPPGAKRTRAQRIGDHMSWQLLHEQEEWEEETHRLVTMLPIVGCVFRKTYYDNTEEINRSVLATAEDVVINYNARSVGTAPRVSEQIKYYPYEIEESVRSGLFLKHEYGPAVSDDEDAPHMYLEQHCRLDLDGDGYTEPYIVTIHKELRKVCRIVARFDEEDIFATEQEVIAKIKPINYYTKYDFLPSVDGGIYGLGFGRLLTPINEATNSVVNQLLDAGTLANTQGGFIGRGLSMRGGALKFKMGEFKQVNAPGGAIRDAVVPIEFPGPSPVLFSLLGLLIEAGKEIGSIKDVLTGDNGVTQNMAPTTLLALIEQGMKVYTAVYKGIYRSATQEYEKLYALNRKHIEEEEYQIGDEWRTISAEDYQEDSGVVPVSDPTMVSDMQRLTKAYFLQQYQDDPFCDGMEIRRRVMEAAQIPNVDYILKQPDPPQPDPLVELRRIELQIQNVKAESEDELNDLKKLETLAKAIKTVAEADALPGDKELDWEKSQISVLKVLLDNYNQRQQIHASQREQGGKPGFQAEQPTPTPTGMTEPQEL